MSRQVSQRIKVSGGGFAPRLRGIGRGVLWVVLGLVLLRGIGQILSGAVRPEVTRGAASESAPGVSTSGLAIRFARAYLTNHSSKALSRFLAEGIAIPASSGPASEGRQVAQAEVVSSEALGGGRAIVTVACEALGGRTLYLAVPIARDEAGEVAVVGAPSLVAAPEVAEVEAERTRPLPGATAGKVDELVDRFLAIYLAGSSSAELAYYLAPGIELQPLSGFALLGQPKIAELTAGGPREVLAKVRARDEATGSSYPLAYRLRLTKRERWYVAGVEGVSR